MGARQSCCVRAAADGGGGMMTKTTDLGDATRAADGRNILNVAALGVVDWQPPSRSSSSSLSLSLDSPRSGPSMMVRRVPRGR
jgi:hypothetical protein